MNCTDLLLHCSPYYRTLESFQGPMSIRAKWLDLRGIALHQWEGTFLKLQHCLLDNATLPKTASAENCYLINPDAPAFWVDREGGARHQVPTTSNPDWLRHFTAIQSASDPQLNQLIQNWYHSTDSLRPETVIALSLPFLFSSNYLTARNATLGINHSLATDKLLALDKPSIFQLYFALLLHPQAKQDTAELLNQSFQTSPSEVRIALTRSFELIKSEAPGAIKTGLHIGNELESLDWEPDVYPSVPHLTACLTSSIPEISNMAFKLIRRYPNYQYLPPTLYEELTDAIANCQETLKINRYPHHSELAARIRKAYSLGT